MLRKFRFALLVAVGSLFLAVGLAVPAFASGGGNAPPPDGYTYYNAYTGQLAQDFCRREGDNGVSQGSYRDYYCWDIDDSSQLYVAYG